MAKQVGLGVLVSVALGDVSGTAAVAMGQQLVGLKFDRDQESEADKFGVRLAYDAGFRPEAIGDFFKRLQKEEKLDEATERTVALLSTHPAHGERLEAIAQLAATFPKRAEQEDPLRRQWAEIRKHAGHVPDDAKQAKPEPDDEE
jgi:predicted Zn-dependent protease